MTGVIDSDPHAQLTRAQLRARLYLRAVLPLIEQLVAAKPHLLPPRLGEAHIFIGLVEGGLGADLWLHRGTARVLAADVAPPTGLAILFRDVGQLNQFFSGQACWPHLRGALHHPRQLLAVLHLLMALQILQPQARPPREHASQALHVRVLLLLVVRALAELARSGQGDFAQWVAHSPERVIQWSAGPPGQDPDEVAVFVRMAQGRVQVGRGIYRQRRPFVHFAFRDVEAALRMLTTPESQMTGLRDGLLNTVGSPEYTRKIAWHMQLIDQLLLEG